MAFRSMTDRYGAVAVTIHWLSAVLILVLLVSGFNAAGSPDAAAKAQALRLHISAGVLVLLLTLARLGWWWIFDQKPEPLAGTPLWQDRAARLVHVALVVVVLGMLASGIGMIVLSGAVPAVFGGAGAKMPDFHDFAPRAPHGLGAPLLIALIAAHTGAALWHHFIRRDGLLGRMWYRL